MKKIDVPVVLDDFGILPQYQTKGSAGADAYARIEGEDPMVIKPMERRLIPIGIKVAIPDGFEIQVRPRSGLALKKGITVLNTPGTIDSDFRSEIGVILINLSNEDFTVMNGDRIAQLILAPVYQMNFVEVRKLDETERGTGGFGHTGV